MIKLKNVSKFYYSKGVVASGFSKLNLELSLGEFVVITGESGSGKSTLLNVLSGLDTYEEGEMYINGEETSHYTEIDREIYRKKYIGNIFQSFNLVNSYTVYQNIELVLLINGFKRKQVKQKILDIIKKVDLQKFKNTKVSKLSGGQKQRVAIARALAKDTPIIVADEPTGNLDSRSATSVLKTLSEVSKDKLVIVVTHNYEQIEEYATRKIKMHDGKILEDKTIKSYEEVKSGSSAEFKNITFFNKLRLGIRNTFNVIPKFLLLLIVYLFVTMAVTSEYVTIKKQEYENSKMGYNNYFKNTSDKRIVINKLDKSMFTDSDYNNISKIDGVNEIVKDDLLLDNNINFSSDEFYLYGTALNIDKIDKVDEGRMPKGEFEIVVEGSKDDNYYFQNVDKLMSEQYTLYNSNNSSEIMEEKITIVGVIYTEEESSGWLYSSDNSKFYVSNTILNAIRRNTNEVYSKTVSNLDGYEYSSNSYSNMYKLSPSSKVPTGYAVISSEMDGNCKKFTCKNKVMHINVSNIYYETELDLTVYRTYTEKNFKKYTGYTDYYTNNGTIYINESDYFNIYNKDNYQSSVFINDPLNHEYVINELKSLGYNTIYLKDTIVNPYSQALKFATLFTSIFMVILTIALFFIAYFIIKIILKSRNIYFSTIRILGASKKTSNSLLNIELFTVFNIAFILVTALIIMIKNNIIQNIYIGNLIKYLNFKDYIILYIILLIISLLITNRYAKKLFKSSAMVTYREEV